jgi:GH25 family lysozyme M1 (1,4-beta-N-acetylmuramidase)
MRRFDPQEVAWLERLAVVARTGPLPAAAFLARVHFSRAAGRGLILQPRGRFGYCYLRPARLATAGAAQDERRELMALLLLLAWLRREHYIAVELDESSAPPLVVVGEAFDAVRAERSRVVLNHEGEYSTEPHQVLSARGEVAYEGLRLEGDAFALAHEWARGTLHASLALQDLLAHVRPPAVEATPAPAEVLPPGAPAPQVREAGAGLRRWSLLELLDKAKALSEGAGVAAALIHAALHLHLAVWLAGLLGAAAAGLHLSGVVDLGKGVRAATALLAGAVASSAPGVAQPGSGAQATPSAAARAPAAPAAPASVASAASAAAQSNKAAVDASTVAPPAPPAAQAGPLHGVDVSKWNGNWVDHLSGPLDGISFVFARASDGRTPDLSFAGHWDAARRYGLVRGSYHFYRVAIDPAQQIDVYLRALGGVIETSDIAPVLDFEAESFPPGAPPPKAKVQADFLRALQLLEQRSGRVPMIYTSRDVGDQWLDDERFARYPLWIADWSQRHAPRLPATWAQQGFRFWQRTDQYRPPLQTGVALDLDWFMGPREHLAR